MIQNGITLIQVPYWWDFSVESLAATIYLERPTLIRDTPHSQPIPKVPPDRTGNLFFALSQLNEHPCLCLMGSLGMAFKILQIGGYQKKSMESEGIGTAIICYQGMESRS